MCGCMVVGAALRRSWGVRSGGEKKAASQKHISPLCGCFSGLELGEHASLSEMVLGSFIHSIKYPLFKNS